MATKRKEEAKKRKNRLLILACAGILIFGIVVSALEHYAPAVLTWKRLFSTVGLDSVSDVDAPMQIHVLDVGKADCILVRCEGKNILIDSGYYDAAGQILNTLEHLGIDRLDLAVATHPDADHIGSMAQVISAVQTDRLMLREPPEVLDGYPSSYQALLDCARALPTEILYASVNDTLTFGALYLYVLGPVRSFEKDNDNSIILRMEYGDTSYLFMGDAEEMAERALCQTFPDLRSDFIKIGHHGSNTSTTEMLLDAVQPQYAAISVGLDNSSLPKEEVLRRLADRGIEYTRTDFDGTCVFYSDGQTIQFKTEEGQR